MCIYACTYIHIHTHVYIDFFLSKSRNRGLVLSHVKCYRGTVTKTACHQHGQGQELMRAVVGKQADFPGGRGGAGRSLLPGTALQPPAGGR